MRTVTTQVEFDAGLAAGETEFALHADANLRVSIAELVIFRSRSGQPRVVASGSSQPRVEAYDSSQPHVVAYDSSQPHVVAFGSSQPRVEASDSSQPRVVASGSSQPRVEAYDSSQPRVVAFGSSQPRVEASDSSQPRVVAFGSSQPHVVAYDSSQPRVVAYDSSQPRVVASGSSQPRVEAFGSSQPRVVAFGSSQLSTAGAVTVDVRSPHVAIVAEQVSQITGTQCHIVQRERPATVEAWCQHYGIAVVDGIARLYKAVDDNFRSGRRFSYAPGTIPIAPDWDGGEQECGHGLHFSPRPILALRFFPEATRFLACPVALADIRAPRPDDDYPEKVKAHGCCGPITEVTIDGEPRPATATEAQS